MVAETLWDVVVIGAGQAGLASARALRRHGLHTVVLESRAQPTGSWPGYYDSLRLFSPARFSALPGLPFPGDPDRYPARDDVVAYLREYADLLDVEIRCATTVATVDHDPEGFAMTTEAGDVVRGRAVVSATGAFTRPEIPVVPGAGLFGGAQLHSGAYRSPAAFADRRVAVVGGGNSAVQIAHELAAVADVTLVTRSPIRFRPQRIAGRDVHLWLHRSGLDIAPGAVTRRLVRTTTVLDPGGYAAALAAGRIRQRPMFEALDETGARWADGATQRLDAIVWATGFRPALQHLRPLGLGDDAPTHRGGVSTTVPGLAFVGLEMQRSFSSSTLRGVGRDAAHVGARIAARLGGRARALRGPAGRLIAHAGQA
ncbi:monooxygenase [Cellulomonas chitinilytica]|uniref:Monooxygenase n=1 Tax=Cellulomonas chitinilytica TaxID=398759 RepID=A0A919P581_9CELL|nr:NAD(P)/FAD-dependent oxidoreductase [Cellulomonas chitinilytica]GIG23622.1 monooxygenase [Cellulomonas chitinilytica]